MREFILVLLCTMGISTYVAAIVVNIKLGEQQKIIKLLCEASPECKKEMNK